MYAKILIIRAFYVCSILTIFSIILNYFNLFSQVMDMKDGPPETPVGCDTTGKPQIPDPESILEQLRARTPLIKAMLTPTLTEEEVKEALGEDKVIQTFC